MAEDSSNPLGLPPSMWIAVIVGVAGVFALNQHPFQDVRPADATAPVYRHTPSEDQDVEARLWEDPLGAAATAKAGDDREATASAGRKGVDSRPPPNPEGSAATHDHTMKRLRTLLKNNDEHIENVLILGAIVPGAPYADAIETRRRIRYAVLAGLHRANFVPENSEHVGYISLARIYHGEPSPGHDIAAYEWLKPDDTTAAPHRRVLILWLDQDGFRARPLWHFQKLMDDIDPAVKSAGEPAIAETTDHEAPPILTTAILGPADSDGLLAMREELCPDAQHKCGPTATIRRDIAVYSPRATVADEWLLDEGKCRAIDKRQPLPDKDTLAGKLFFWSEQHVRLYRLVADDCAVTHALWTELSRRGVQVASQIALVAERDTLYARRMGRYFGECAVSPRIGADIQSGDRGQHPLCFTYLRGLDGLAPPVPDAGDGAEKSGAGKGSDSSRSPDAGGAPSEAATGQGQLDYLRRLASALAARVDRHGCRQSATVAGESPADPDAAATCPPFGILAIGVLGSDMYDKLLVMQALRNSFPRVTFFTTDMDAQLLDRANLQWTRHLVVGSSLGLELRPELQSSIPPFRDSYQSSMYFSTIVAVHRYLQAAAAGRSTAPEPAFDPGLGSEWTQRPQVFEIGRTQAFDLTDERYSPGTCVIDKECLSIAAHGRASFWANGSHLTGLQIGAVLAALTFIVIWVVKGTVWVDMTLNVLDYPNTNRKLWRRRIGVLSCLAAVAFASMMAWPFLIERITFGKTRLPTPIFGGASLWAAGLIEAASVVLVIALLLRGQRKLDENVEKIRTEFQMKHTITDLLAWRSKELKTWRARWREISWFPSNHLSADWATPLKDQSLSPIEALMARYLYRGHRIARLLRVTTATVLSTLALLFLEQWAGKSLVGGTELLHAGSAESAWVAGISIVSLLALQWLIFWVADAMFLSRSFFLDLLYHQPEWPSALVDAESKRLALQKDWTNMWLNLRLIARRTDCVADLVLYPSIVIAGLTLAALTVEFGELGFASNPIALLGSAALVVLAAVLLRSVAERWRSSVRGTLEDFRLALQATNPDGGGVSQLKTLLGWVKQLHEGAFASYAQQPLVKAVLVPALTFAATIGLQYLHLTP
jgi:hypothetical protein